jgi:hypothetical protein
MGDPGQQATRWYRGETVTPLTLGGAALLALGLVILYVQGSSPAILLSQRIEAVVPALVGVYLIVFNRLAGIGVRSDGVIVRSALGGKQPIPWTRIVRFEVIPTPNYKYGQMIAVIDHDGKPWTTFGCWFDKALKQSRTARMDQVLSALEAARVAALA